MVTDFFVEIKDKRGLKNCPKKSAGRKTKQISSSERTKQIGNFSPSTVVYDQFDAMVFGEKITSEQLAIRGQTELRCFFPRSEREREKEERNLNGSELERERRLASPG